MQGKGLISVIVPVYNVEQYLTVCVQSILQQSYEKLEVLLVDDGSTDRSGQLCDAWQKEDSRIRVFHQKNGGLSAARNTGIRKANGEYLCFVDSDDCIHPDYLKRLYGNLLAFNADVSCCRYTAFSDTPEGEAENDSRLCTREYLWDTLTDVGANCKSTWLVVAWNKLIRRELLKDIEFPVGKWHEDEFFIHRLLLCTNCFVDTSAQLYYYRKRADSISGNENQSDIRHLDMVDAWAERVKAYRRDSRNCFQEAVLESMDQQSLGQKSMDQQSIEQKRMLQKKRMEQRKKRLILYHKMVAAYRMTIRIQYSNFNQGIPAIWLKLRYLWSYFQYPEIEWHLRMIAGKGWK